MSQPVDPFAEREAQNYQNPIPSREFILNYFQEIQRPLSFKDLMQDLNIDGPEQEEGLSRRLKAMIRDLQLDRLKGNVYWPSSMRVEYPGRVLLEKGRIWFQADDGSEKIKLPFCEGLVFDQDKVIISLANLPEPHLYGAKLISILEQKNVKVIGRFVIEDDINYIIPHGKEINQDILVAASDTLGAKNADIVVAVFTNRQDLNQEPEAKIIEILGQEDTSGIEIASAVRAFGLPHSWPEDLQDSIKSLTEEVLDADKVNRHDLRELPLITIDGEDAKDFDDAVFCEADGDDWHLIVAIADVSHYVKAQSPLDIEALTRGNSVYFPGKVLPMLPEILSNQLCSLKPDVDRLCMVCDMHISQSGELLRYKFSNGLMRSHARLTYTKAAALLNNSKSSMVRKFETIMPNLQALHSVYKALKEARTKRGAIDFESNETRIVFGENGKINHIEPVIRNVAHLIIEECMLVANEATARFFQAQQLPGLYRNHEGPALDKLGDLKSFLNEMGLGLGGGKEPTPKDFAALISKISTRSDAHSIQIALLRSLSQAIYHPSNEGHFGLAYEAYCHFTSPIRRYPDLYVHRQIKRVLAGEWQIPSPEPSLEEQEQGKEQLADLTALGAQCSMTERRADDATRDVVRWLKCQYMAKHLGKIHQGNISGVTRFGFFVELKELFIDGLVHVATLGDDYYVFNPNTNQLEGEHGGQVFKLGQELTVCVSRVDVAERKIDFEWINDKKPKSAKKPTKRKTSPSSKSVKKSNVVNKPKARPKPKVKKPKKDE